MPLTKFTPHLTHAARLGCLCLLLYGLHIQADKYRVRPDAQTISISSLDSILPEAATIRSTGEPPVWEVRNADDQPIALLCLTSPQADNIVGYAGPNNVLLIMDMDGKVVSTRWLHSYDTVDHVERVKAADSFWAQFHGRSLGQANNQPIDGVSGATLTSLAIAEAIEVRLSGRRPSLRFPQDFTLEEIQSIYPEAQSWEDERGRSGMIRVKNSNGERIGWLLRTGTIVDDKIGYQGPTELLLAINEEDRVTKIKLRKSYDNEPYVRYTKMEAAFWSHFVGRTLSELSEMELKAEGIEGVSGATMTSMAAAETVQTGARRLLDELRRADVAAQTARAWNWSWSELATALLAVMVIPWSWSRWRGDRRWRWVWQVVVLAVLVGLSGNLISLALLSGWTRSLPPLTLAPGLVLLAIVTIAMPTLFGRNVYCDHLCPHGILQQWMSRVLGKRRKQEPELVSLQPRLASAVNAGSSEAETAKPSSGKTRMRTVVHRALKLSAVAILCIAVVSLLAPFVMQLTIFEPFDVYAWRVGWSVSAVVFIASLVLAAKEPMGYCRLACPTGMLLESMRRRRAGRRLLVGDMLLLAATIFVWLIR